jgi:hypothetical protein
MPSIFRLMPLAATVAIAATLALSTPAHAQQVLKRGLVLRTEWQQGSEELTRSTLPSNAITMHWQTKRGWRMLGGFSRTARDLSTVQGGTLGVEVPLRLWRVALVPGAYGMFGAARVAEDTRGYDVLTPERTIRRIPGYTVRSAGAAGVGAGLALEVALLNRLALRASAQQWQYTASPLADNQGSRFQLGAGANIYLGALGLREREMPCAGGRDD